MTYFVMDAYYETVEGPPVVDRIEAATPEQAAELWAHKNWEKHDYAQTLNAVVFTDAAKWRLRVDAYLLWVACGETNAKNS